MKNRKALEAKLKNSEQNLKKLRGTLEGTIQVVESMVEERIPL